MASVEQTYEALSTIAVGTDGQLVVAPSAGGTATIDTGRAQTGTKSVLIDATGVQVVLGYTPTGTAGLSFAVRTYYYIDAAKPNNGWPTSTGNILNIRNASAAVLAVQIDATGHIVVLDAVPASKNTSSVTMPSGWIRVEAWATASATAGQGNAGVAVYAGDSTTALYTYTASANSFNAGTTNLVSARAGKLTTAGNWTTSLDNFAVELGRASFIGPTAAIGGGGGGGATVLLSDDFTGTTGTAFSGDSTYTFLVGTAPTYVRNSKNGKALRFAAAAQGIITDTFASSTPGLRVFSRIYRLSASPTATCEVAQTRNGAARGTGLAFAAGGLLKFIRPDASSPGTGSGSGAVPVPIGTDFRVTYKVDPANNLVSASFYPDVTSTTASETISTTIGDTTAGTAFRDGVITAGGLGAGVTLDVSWPIDTSDTDPGPRAYPTYATVLPQANAGPDVPGIEPWTVQTLTGTDLAESSAITGRAWSCVTAGGPTITPTGTGTATYVAPPALASTALTFRYSVTSADGTSTDDAIHTVLPATRAYLDGGGVWRPTRRIPL